MKAGSFFSFSFSLSRFLFFFSLGFKMKVVQFFEDLVVDVSRVFLVLHCGIDGVPAFLQTCVCKVRNLSTVTKFWRIIYETLKRAFLQLFPGPEHLNNISPVCCRHIVEREIVLAGKSEALGCHLWWKFLQIDEKMSLTPNLHVLVDFVGSKQCWDCWSILPQLRVPGGQVLVCYLEKTGFAVLIE